MRTLSRPDLLVFITMTILLIVSVGCSSREPLPTLVATAFVQENTPTVQALDTLVNGSALAPTFLPTTPLPTVTDPPTPQLTETSTATPVVSTRVPTPLPPSGVNITSPEEGTIFQLGQQINVSGRSQLSASQMITISLTSVSGNRLFSSPARIDDLNNWRATIDVPHEVTGPAIIEATVHDDAGQPISSDSALIQLVLSEDPGDRYLTLFRPQIGELAVSGFNLLFDGHAQRPVNNLVTVSLWTDACQQLAASQSFPLNGSGDWWGLLFVPNNIQGETCAVAHFGSPGEEDWREAQTLVKVVRGDDSSANAIVIALPREGSTEVPGQSIEIKGLAYNAPDRIIKATLMLNNGRLLNEGVTAVDQHGYWELSLFVPPDAEGDAQIIVSAGLEGTDVYRQTTTAIVIQR